MKDYPSFDYSLIDNVDYWYVENIKNEQAKAEMIEKLKNTPPAELNKKAQ